MATPTGGTGRGVSTGSGFGGRKAVGVQKIVIITRMMAEIILSISEDVRLKSGDVDLLGGGGG